MKLLDCSGIAKISDQFNTTPTLCELLWTAGAQFISVMDGLFGSTVMKAWPLEDQSRPTTRTSPPLAVGTLLASFANLADFPRIWTCFFLELRVACFWACVNWNLLDFWACFLQISVLRIAIFRFLALLLFQCTAKCILGAFLWKYAHFGLVYSDLPPWFFIWFSCWFFSFCWSFLPTHLGFFFA